MRKGFPRTLFTVLIGLGLSILAGAGTVWAHYRSTPTFREWARARPVDEALWRSHVPAGVELSRGTSWRSDDGPARERFGQWRARFTAQHGDELLLDLEVEVRVESRAVEDSLARGVPSEAFEGLEAFLVEHGRDPDFHAVAVLTLHDLSAFTTGGDLPGLKQGPRMQLDVFALAGAGDVELVVQEVSWTASGREGPLLGGRDFSDVAAGIVPVLDLFADPPSEGLAYQARAKVYPTWSQVQGGSRGASRGPKKLAATTRLYSAGMKAIHAFRAPFDPRDHFGVSTSIENSLDLRWNGEVW